MAPASAGASLSTRRKRDIICFMKTVRFIYYVSLAVVLLAIAWYLQMSSEFSRSIISAQQGGYYNPGMGGAGMATLAPLALGVLSFLLFNILGVTLLTLDKRKKILREFEKIFIKSGLLLLLLLVGWYLVIRTMA
jgi:hypothetical protein